MKCLVPISQPQQEAEGTAGPGVTARHRVSKVLLLQQVQGSEGKHVQEKRQMA